MKPIDFLKIAVRDYKVGAVTPSSKYVVREIVGALRPGDKFIIEYGAGSGVVTRGLLGRLPPDGRLVAVELNQQLLAELRRIRDPRLTVLSGDVVALSEDFSVWGLPRVDAVVSGIPFSFFAPAIRKRIIANTYRGLAPEGLFLVYQFSVLILPLLKKLFRRVSVSFELLNFPPYFLMRAEK